VKPGSTLTEVRTRLILLVILQLLMNTMCLNDTLKRGDNPLNINLDTRKSSFVEEVADDFYQSSFLEPISTHGADKSLYFS
jgi:hypothetical protein